MSRDNLASRLRLHRKEMPNIAERVLATRIIPGGFGSYGYTAQEVADALTSLFASPVEPPELAPSFTLTKSDGMQLLLPSEFNIDQS